MWDADFSSGCAFKLINCCCSLQQLMKKIQLLLLLLIACWAAPPQIQSGRYTFYATSYDASNQATAQITFEQPFSSGVPRVGLGIYSLDITLAADLSVFLNQQYSITESGFLLYSVYRGESLSQIGVTYIASLGEPIVLRKATSQITTNPLTSSWALSEAIPQFMVSKQVKVDVLIPSLTFQSVQSPLFSIRVKATPNPMSLTRIPDSGFLDYNDPAFSAPFTDASNIEINSNSNSPQWSAQITVVIHTYKWRSAPTILTGYTAVNQADMPAGSTYYRYDDPLDQIFKKDGYIQVLGFNTIKSPGFEMAIEVDDTTTLSFFSNNIGTSGSAYLEQNTPYFFYIDLTTCSQTSSTFVWVPPPEGLNDTSIPLGRGQLTETTVTANIGTFITADFNLEGQTTGGNSTLTISFDDSPVFSRTIEPGVPLAPQSMQANYQATSGTVKITLAVSGPGTATWFVNDFKVTTLKYSYTSDDSCADSCTEGLVPLNGLYASFCVTCYDITERSDFVYNPQTRKCDCPAKNYDTGTTCEACSTKRCDVCAQNVCTRCEDGTAPSNPNECPCQPSQWMNSNQDCVACPYACTTCQSDTHCTSCKPDSHRLDDGTTCPCENGWFDSGNDVCDQCPYKCATCQSTAAGVSCATCAENRDPATGCDCAAKFYEDPDTKICMPCQPTCATCTGPSSSDCTNCIDTRFLTAAGYCVCADNYTSDATWPTCVKVPCGDISPGCIDCYNTTCTKCDAASHWVLGAGRCTCAVGYYFNGDVCVSCPLGCKNCSGAVCFECIVGLPDPITQACSCPPGQYPNLDTVACIPCTTYCSVCADSGSCAQCSTGFTPDAGKCSCPVGRFINNATQTCDACRNNCAVCSSLASCTLCDSGYSPTTTGDCVANCSANSSCICPANCAQCSNSYSCSACNRDYYLLGLNCLRRCPDGTYNTSDAKCRPCSSSCRTCSVADSNCTSCRTPTYLFNGGCVQACPVSYSANDYSRSCVKCAVRCLTCLVDNETVCRSCQPGYYFYNGTCLDACPANTSEYNDRCYDRCPSRTYAVPGDPPSCEKCSSPCLACSSNSTCLSCVRNYYLYNGSCDTTCPRGLYPNRSQVCTACSETTCKTCKPGTLLCAECADGLILVEGTCQSKCRGSSYYDGTKCRPCPANCQLCNAAQCLVCTSPYFLVNGRCASCSNLCKTCVQGTSICTSCPSGQVLTPGGMCSSNCPAWMVNNSGICVCASGYEVNGSCVQTCPVRSGPNSRRRCEPCPANCLSCANNHRRCSECEFGYSEIRGSCQANSRCSEGQGSSNNRTCVNLCVQGTFYYRGFCVDRCPRGTVLNASRLNCIDLNATVESQTVVITNITSTGSYVTSLVYIGGTSCSAGSFAYHTICLARCPAGTYASSGYCLECSRNCIQCTNASVCLSCAPGYFPSETGTCVRSVVCGSSSQYSLGDRCVSSCPYGTYADGRSCVRICGSTQAYANGYCYDSCPSSTFNNGYGCDPNCVKVNGVCAYGTTELGCRVGEYLNFTTNRCQRCQSPCATCSSFPNNCTSCISGTLVGTSCIAGSGQAVTVRVVNASKSGNIISVQLAVNAYPTGLGSNDQGQFFKVYSSGSRGQGSSMDAFQFYQNGSFYVNIVGSDIKSGDTIYFQLNIPAVGKAYNANGYTDFSNAYAQVSVSGIRSGAVIASTPASAYAFAARVEPVTNA